MEKLLAAWPSSRMPASMASLPATVTIRPCCAARRASARCASKPISRREARLVSSQKTNSSNRSSDSTAPRPAPRAGRGAARAPPQGRHPGPAGSSRAERTCPAWSTPRAKGGCVHYQYFAAKARCDASESPNMRGGHVRRNGQRRDPRHQQRGRHHEAGPHPGGRWKPGEAASGTPGHSVPGAGFPARRSGTQGGLPSQPPASGWPASQPWKPGPREKRKAPRQAPGDVSGTPVKPLATKARASWSKRRGLLSEPAQRSGWPGA